MFHQTQQTLKKQKLREKKRTPEKCQQMNKKLSVTHRVEFKV